MADRAAQLHQDTAYGFIDSSIEAPQVLNPRLISNSPQANMHQAIRDALRGAKSFSFSIAFISSSALALLKQELLDFVGHGEIITSNYLDFNEPSVFRELLNLDNVDVYLIEDEHAGFHPKGYVFDRGTELTAIVGSSNLTTNALLRNHEWNLQFSTSSDGDIAFQIDAAIQRQKAHAFRLSEKWIHEYEVRRAPLVKPAAKQLPPRGIVANEMQRRALAGIQELVDEGQQKAVVISATGTGKTILAALAAKQAKPRRILFIAHREQILIGARREFARVFAQSPEAFGLYVGAHKDIDHDHVFASIQSLTRNDNYRSFSPDTFDFIVVDEVHRSAATTYRQILKHFKPRFLLGLTATPERTDSQDIFELFDYNVPYEIRLQEALEENMLVPFHYFGVTDYITEGGELVEDTSTLSRLVSQERLLHILDTLRVYGLPQQVKGLMFCSRKDEALELSQLLNQSKVNGRLLRTTALLGDDNARSREYAVARLEAGELDYILTVDIFNEGIDIPCVNQIVMLRGTESSIVFTQQLGRGLRKFPGKDHLRVIDFIGNYKNNYLIPVALFGDNSRSKDSLRQKLISIGEDNTLAGVSSVNFDEISKQKIYSSISTAKIDTQTEFKKDISTLFSRLNRIPKLYDFARFDTVDPFVIATRRTNHYWELLLKLKYVDKQPSPLESKFLKFLSKELLTGKQPQELVLLQELLHRGTITEAELQEVLAAKGMAHGSADISVMEKVLNLNFYPDKDYDLPPLVDVSGSSYVLGKDFSDFYHASIQDSPESFRSHVDDIVETGLFRSREKSFWQGVLKIGNRYSRKDVSRILGLKSNQMSTLYGYKVDDYSGSIPVFVNYHKSADIDASIAYEDRFLNHETMQWFSKSNRTLRSGEVVDIVNRKYPMYLFVKRDDSEGEEFYYLGLVNPKEPQQTKMAGKGGKLIDVVTMKLDLDSPLDEEFYNYLHEKI
ncbi:DUF3427 domain-containing protein [Corynebacterium flavescens]|uniref:DUF3427 domain-containing protein n=1 Tax=Corynebacterium flavescens TaxID=28028 RepID=UPI003FD20ABF